MTIRSLLTLFLILTVSLASFYSGVKYEQVRRQRQEILIFANLYGDQIIEVNRLFESIEDQSETKLVLNKFNKEAILNAGCSLWHENLVHFEPADYKLFSSGIILAFESIEEASPNVWGCLDNLTGSNIVTIEKFKFNLDS